MVMTLGIMLVGAVILTTLVMVVMFNSTRTVQTRAELSALQSADAGIDTVLQQLEGLSYDQLNTVCGATFMINNDAVTVDTLYTVRSGTTLTEKLCPSASDLVTKVTLRSTAVTAADALTDSLTRTVVATLVPTPPQVFLEKAVFSESSTLITNGTKLFPSSSGAADAHVYANGGIRCEANVAAGGSIYAAFGDVDMYSECEVGNTVWASGKVIMRAGNAVIGDVYAASTLDEWGVEIQNSQARVTGSILTNGGVRSEGTGVIADPTFSKTSTGGIGGVVYSRSGNIDLPNSGEILGSAYAGKSIVLGNASGIGRDAFASNGTISGKNKGNVITGVAKATGAIDTTKVTVTSGSVFQLQPAGSVTAPVTTNPTYKFDSLVGYGSTIQSPQREPLPYLTLNDPDDTVLWEGADYTIETVSGYCSADQVDAVVNDPAKWTRSGRLIEFTGCSTAVDWGTKTLSLPGNLAMVSRTGFTAGAGFFMKSSEPGVSRDVFWLVPADTVKWNPVSWYPSQSAPDCSVLMPGVPVTPNIYIRKIKFTDLNLMAYTPCEFDWETGLDSSSDPWTGQIYAGNVDIHNSFDLKMTKVPVPSLVEADPDLTDDAALRVVSRFDIRD